MASEGSQVVIGYDGSEFSEYALEWYVKFMHQPSHHVTLVHVPEINEALHSNRWATWVYDREMLGSLLKDEHDRIKADLEKYSEKMKALGLGGHVKSVAAHKPGEGIVKECEAKQASLVVVGSRGKGAVRRTLVGSVSDYVMHHCHCPVLVVRHPKHFHLHKQQSTESQ